MISDFVSPQTSLERNIEELLALKEDVITKIRLHRENVIERIQIDTETIIQELEQKIHHKIEHLEQALSLCRSGKEFDKKLASKLLIKFQVSPDSLPEVYKKSITCLISNSKPSENILYNFIHTTNQLDTYNIIDQSTSSISDLPFVNFASPSITRLPDNTLFIAGGVDCSDFDARTRVIVYDPRDNTFTTRPDMIRRRSYHPANLVDNFIYVFGGSESDHQGNQGMLECERFDLNHNRWQPIASLHDRRSAHCSAEYNKKIYIFGGWGTVASIEMYDTVRDVMTMLDVTLAVPGSSACCNLDADIIVFHGNAVSLFDPESKRVSSYGELSDVDPGWGIFSNYPPINLEGVIFMVRAWENEFYKYDMSEKTLVSARLDNY
jgi:hypothetical protein